MMLSRLLALVATCCMALVLVTSPVRAEISDKLTVGAVQEMVKGLGYDTTVDKQLIRFVVSGKHDVPFVMILSEDATILYINAQVENIDKDKLPKVPAVKLLEYNDTHPDFFSLNKSDSGETIYLIGEIGGAEVKARSLRETIDRMVGAIDTQDEMLNQANWK